VADTVFCAESGENLSGERYSFMVREGRNWAVGDRVLCAERGRNWVVSDTVFSAERRENLSGGRYSVVCWEREKLSGGRYNVVCWERVAIERWAIKCCVLRDRINWAMFVTLLCAEREEYSNGGYTVLCAERRKNWSVGRYNVLCWLRGEIERWAIRSERKILPALKAPKMNAAPLTMSSRAMVS